MVAMVIGEHKSVSRLEKVYVEAVRRMFSALYIIVVRLV